MVLPACGDGTPAAHMRSRKVRLFHVAAVRRAQLLGRRSNKVVVITGASAGVGRAAAREFARDGANVALFARNGDALDNARAEVCG